ncbi:MAG: hypothetical protein P1U56_06335 [Saprospiraceae bacterium]|nr:hypothetical protein [Saprospiraceae bacterium]
MDNIDDTEINAIEILNVAGLSFPHENFVGSELYVGHVQVGCYYLRLVSNSIVETFPFIKI